MATATKRPAKAKRPATARKPAFVTIDDLLDSLGGVSPKRVRFDPPPGTARPRDVLRLRQEEGRLFELVNGTLVEKAMSVDASYVAGALIQLVRNHSTAGGGLGMVLPPDGFVKLSSRYVRAPDLSFTAWDRLPNRKVPREPMATLAPDLAVEVLSPTNTRAEMARKRDEYFDSGVRLVWIIDPRKQTVQVYTSPDDVTDLGPVDTLTGGHVLPGFAVKVADLFADLADEPPAKPKPKKRKK